MSVGNGTGPMTVHISREQDLAAFDRLPPVVRKAMSEAIFNRLAVEVEIQVKRLGAERVAQLLPVADRVFLRDEAANG